MANFMPAHGADCHQIKNSHVAPGLCREIEELQGIAPDFIPMRNSYSAHDRKSSQTNKCEPPGINPGCVSVKPGKKFVRVYCGKGYLRQVAVFTLSRLQRFPSFQ